MIYSDVNIAAPSYHKMPKVFISYSHDSLEHMDRVLDISDRLRVEGIDCTIDQYEMSPARGWAHWTASQIEDADFVLVVCTEIYMRRFKGKEQTGTGLGVKWEGAVITQEIYSAEANNTKFIPILFAKGDSTYIPTILRSTTCYEVFLEKGYQDLYRHLTNQPHVLKPEIGMLRQLPPLKRNPTFQSDLMSSDSETESLFPNDVDSYFVTQRRIIEEHAKRFTGRTYVLQCFNRFMIKNSRGYFIVRGGPGQGKTALSCHLVKTYNYIHHFISRTGGRSDARLILRSLLTQIIPLSKTKVVISDNLSDLTKTFQELLILLTEKQNKLILVIDALDELVEDLSDEFPFLATDALPEGAYVVVTSRPGIYLNRLEEYLFTTPYEMFDLGPLEISEMREILRVQYPGFSEAETERIAEASQGNPLYLRAAAEELGRNLGFDLRDLPSSIEGFFRRAIKSIYGNSNKILHDLLGILAVVRKPLNLRELSQILGERQRQVYEHGISHVRQFLFEVDDSYCFYHVGFHDFVAQELLYEDELRECHRMVSDWLQHPESRVYEYRWSSLAYHLFASASHVKLNEVIDHSFLIEKVRRYGYAVLEDVELLARSLLDAGDPTLVEKCVEIVEGLRETVGGDIIEDTKKAIQPYRPGPTSFRTQLITPTIPSVPGLDVYVGVLPKVDVAADFFEIIPLHRQLVIAIGDVPAVGLKSAFVARFIGNVFRKLVSETGQLHLGKIMDHLNSTISAHEYFKCISMQCVNIDPARGTLAIVNAAQPYPVLYSARRGKCDRLPVRGNVLQPLLPEGMTPEHYKERHAEITRGDILVLLTDGLTEGHLLMGDPYGYRFTQIVERMAGQSAKYIGEAILDDWRSHNREGDYADDVTVIIAVMN